GLKKVLAFRNDLCIIAAFRNRPSGLETLSLFVRLERWEPNNRTRRLGFMKKLLLVAILLTGCLTPPLRADTSVVFNEIMYHPASNALEWVELHSQMAV